MPRYEMSLILKVLERPQMVEALKRTAAAVMSRGGTVRGFENVGQRTLPYHMHKHGESYKTGNYMLVHFDGAVKELEPLMDHLHRDVDIIRPRILRAEIEDGRPCQTKPCHFGELTDEARSIIRKDLKKHIKKL